MAEQEVVPIASTRELLDLTMSERARLVARVPASEAEWRRIDERLAELRAQR